MEGADGLSGILAPVGEVVDILEEALPESTDPMVLLAAAIVVVFLLARYILATRRSNAEEIKPAIVERPETLPLSAEDRAVQQRHADQLAELRKDLGDLHADVKALHARLDDVHVLVARIDASR